ncbi:hypothetical protein SLNSH_14835 [Alsobacter soli]|uniref:Response regulatory domain-containing protein n=1 Tax=Alsobacter soli TaxID=2109933 RepID=A0A2T1HRJ9_9HYPH|nr:response regulator transcription factor [Alsobacter soli]PSC04263.1 hypothetical protein SLNSH_14835 [Alsobacter soli]
MSTPLLDRIADHDLAAGEHAAAPSPAEGNGHHQAEATADKGYPVDRSRAEIGLLLVGSFRLERECLAQAIQKRCPQFKIFDLDFDPLQLEQLGEWADVVVLSRNGLGRAHEDIRVALDALRASTPAPATMIISDLSNEQDALWALKSGAAGVFSMDEGVQLLIAAIQVLLAGGRYVPAKVLTHWCEQGGAVPQRP